MKNTLICNNKTEICWVLSICVEETRNQGTNRHVFLLLIVTLRTCTMIGRTETRRSTIEMFILYLFNKRHCAQKYNGFEKDSECHPVVNHQTSSLLVHSVALESQSQSFSRTFCSFHILFSRSITSSNDGRALACSAQQSVINCFHLGWQSLGNCGRRFRCATCTTTWKGGIPA